jgi:hypothetical protein
MFLMSRLAVVVTMTVALMGVFPETHSYGGTWPVTIANSDFGGTTGCLTINGTGNAGSASLVLSGNKYQYGAFVILNGIFVATMQEPLYGQNGALTFSASADRGHLSKGVFENIEGGSDFNVGSLTFGKKISC